MRKKGIKKAICALLVASMVIGANGSYVSKADVNVIAGTPYTQTGNYDVTVNHVIINQVYGGGNNKGGASNGFIELYNPTDETVDLSTWSVQYEGSTGDDKNTAGWHKLDLTGTIPAHGSYLIRTKKYKEDTLAHNYYVPEGDMQWDDVTINGKGVSVVLMSNQELLTDNNVYDNTTKKPIKSGYVDMIGVNGNDSMESEYAPTYEGYATDSQSTKKAVRRVAFKDTDCNAVGEDDGDLVIVEYNATDTDYLTWAHPRTTADGAWYASEQPEFKETTSLSETEVNVITNTFGSNVETDRQITWQMPTTVTTGSVAISTNKEMTSQTTTDATYTVNNKGTANVFRGNITGLKAATTYYYQVKSGTATSAVYSFTTGSLSNDFTFVHASDSQSKTEAGYDIFQKAITKITETYNSSFVLESGDLVDTNYFEDEWRWLIGKSQNVFANTAYIPVIGNHEQSSAYDAWAYREHFSVPNACTDTGVTPGTVYSFDYGKAHMVVLNTECKGAGMTAQAEWLKKDLAATTQKYIIVSMHRGIYGGAGIAEDVKEAFLPVFDKYNVDLVLFGHDHFYVKTKSLKNGVEDANGTVYLQGGGCASKQDTAKSELSDYEEIIGTPGKPVYNIVSVADSAITVKTVTVDESNNNEISSFAADSSLLKLNDNAQVDFTVLPKTRVPETTTEAPTTQKPTVKPQATTKAETSTKALELKLKKVTKVKAKVGKKKVSLSWGKVSKATSYQVKYATNKKLTKGKKVVTVKTTKKVLKKLKSKKTYYFTVRACAKNTNKKKVYGKWSTVKKVKVK